MDRVVFKVIAPRQAKPKTDHPTFVLQQDNWNDFAFRTQYQLYYRRPGTAAKQDEDLIGSVKILRRGQKNTDGLQISKDFEALGQDFCSVGESLDYYERLSGLGPDIRSAVLNALRDVVQDPLLVEQFHSEEGWSISLFRDQKDEGSEFRRVASSLVTGDYTSLAADGLEFSFHLPGWEQTAGFSFKAPPVGQDDFFLGEAILPERIAVLVGRNGSGKSTLLARLARVAFGSVSERADNKLLALGQIEPNGIGFPRIISVTFSPFDSFRLPGSDSRKRRQVVKEVDKGEGRFVFIGLRDIVKEQTAGNSAQSELDAGAIENPDDRLVSTRLKSIDELAKEFASFITRIKEKNREPLFEKVLDDLLSDSPFGNIDYLQKPGQFESIAISSFLRCSTGHKIVLLIASGLIANIEPRSLVLIDEPETHLHPPLLAALMHAMRRILHRHSAFAIVATHSPVVVQESLARHVKVIRREGALTQINPIRIESFGEGLGLITAEVFGLQSNATDFHHVLDEVTAKLKSLEAIEALFQDGAMSHQARAYVMSLLSKSNED
jgi:predicted ATPase